LIEAETGCGRISLARSKRLSLGQALTPRSAPVCLFPPVADFNPRQQPAAQHPVREDATNPPR
jgi:hypothetical protein